MKHAQIRIEATPVLGRDTCAKAAGLIVTLTADGRRVWSPAAKKPAPRTVHVILNADGTETPFSKVKR